MTNAKLGTFEELLTDTDEAIQAIATRLRALIREVDPDAVEVVRLGDRAATWGVGPQKMKDGYCYLMPQATWVNLGFYQGAALDDPGGLLEGTGAKMRHVKVRSVEEAGQAALRALIVAAHAERRAARR